MMKETSNQAVNKVTSLECGASLAEREHNTAENGAPLLQPRASSDTFSISSIHQLRSTLASDVITSSPLYEIFASPFETKHDKHLTVPLVYCDQTASNRPLRSIEQYLARNCYPLYGNTHTNTSITGSQSTAFCAEARQIVAEATNAKITGKASLDVVLFAGNGTTSAVELLIDCLGIKVSTVEREKRPVVFIGPYEHHSNLLPWRESGCEIVMVPECNGNVDMTALETLLTKPEYANRLKMGTFSAASNVNGKMSNVDAIASCLHRHGALAFFDYATGAPYMPINMNPPPSTEYPSAAKDAIFLSPHKMLGGVGTPGVLVVKKHLVNQVNAPTRSGGGTVFYVTNTHHRFLSNRIERYEGGTPNITGIMRTGLAFLLKRKSEEQYAMLRSPKDPETLLDYDCATYTRVVETLSKQAPNLVMLSGNDGQRHLPIFSFLIRCGRRFLHYNYVCALLNDVFGIQSRGGCQCSGPYSQRLMGLTKINAEGQEVPNEMNEQVESALVNYKERAEVLRPGYTRLSLPFKGVRDEEVDYVVKALEWISKHGWVLMCQYRCNHRTGEWRHSSRQGKPLGRTERKWLSHYDMLKQEPSNGPMTAGANTASVDNVLQETLARADTLLQEARTDQSSISQALKMTAAEGSDEDFIERLRWFVYPKECAVWVSEGRTVPPDTDLTNILGALRPLQVNFATNTVANGNCEKAMDDTAARENRKRKLSPSAACDATQERLDQEGEVGERGLGGSQIPAMLPFRDGEHTGEATLEEIAAGYDDGELTDHCEIFDSNEDAWVPIESFLQSNESQASPAEKHPPIKTTEHVTERSSPVEGYSAEESHTSQLPESSHVIEDVVNQRKKPQRDSSTWGSTAFLPVDTKPAAVATATPQAEAPAKQQASPSSKKKRGRGVRPPPKLMRYITQAMIQWDMIKDGDRLLLGLSGGKDSLSLLHCLLEFQRKLPTKFEIEVCTIDPMTPSFDPSPLIPYVESLGLKYHYIRDDIVSRANTSGKDGKVVKSLCAFCARMKRGNLYTCARRNNCNKLVLAQHLDDCAESFMMSMMHNGFLRTMKAHYEINAGDLSVIRPMVYCRESLMTDFAKSANLPVINENCPACFEEPKERARIKKMLAREETLYPTLYDNIRRALIPLLHDNATAILRSYLEEAVSKSRKVGVPKMERGKKQEVKKDDAAHENKRTKTLLSEASEDDLVMELARRKAEKYKLAGAMKRLDEADEADPTGQVCTLNGGDGSIPCRELME